MMTWRKQTHLSSLCVYAMCIMAADAVSPPRACVFCARTRKESDLRYFAFIFDGLCHIVDYRNGRLILIVPGPNSLLVVVLERERENGVGGIYIVIHQSGTVFNFQSVMSLCWMFAGYCCKGEGRASNRLTHIWWCKPFGVCWCWKLLARQHINSPASVAFCYTVYLIRLRRRIIHEHITEWDDDGPFRSRPPKIW